MKTYLNTLLKEKGISQETIIEVQGQEWGTNFIPLSIVIDFLSNANKTTQLNAKNNLIKIDFYNGDIMHFFTYIAKFIAK
jgi:hypothetical protein